jgi:diketogulonate reductase-like aldo/keto reductase
MVKLNNGIEMPVLSFAAEVWDPSTCHKATDAALRAGFRNVWSSMLIGNDCQEAQSAAIQASSVSIRDIFLAGTVNTRSCSGSDDCYQQTKTGAQSQFDILKKSPLDMLMLDYPSSGSGCDGILGQWKAFEELYAAKKVSTIAVSNFGFGQLKCITATASATVPSVNQMRYGLGHGKDPVVAVDALLGVHVMAYSPLSSVDFSDPDLVNIADAHKKSTAQVALRWIVQHNVSIATQSTNPEHLRENADIFDFALTNDEMALLDAKSSLAQVVHM